ncbi:MAG: Na+/H+ antiporter subunit E [Rhizobiales bacterium 32-66-8]|nr:MAG: Na+/H+ antiporter subunit E [Rhizobiales bacterium 32-66-8]
MSRILPFPRLFLALLVMWLLLTQSVSPGQILLGTVVAFLASWTMAAFSPEPVRIRRPLAIARLAGRVFVDVFRSNLAVARIILAGGGARATQDFMVVPLDLRSPYGLATLAIILTGTPGTLWVHYDPAKGDLLLHVLDLVEEGYWTALIKGRYEALLMEIFE